MSGNFFGHMGREGPCCHCGTEHTPLWRSGPPGKPVLCNACGSRWRTRGTLEDYVRKHAHNHPPPCSIPNLNHDPRKPSPNVVGHVRPSSALEEALEHVARKRRSTPVDQHNLVMSPGERFLQQLCAFSKATEIAEEPEHVEPEEVLIFERINHYIPENEIGMGCMLLKEPPSLVKGSSMDESSTSLYHPITSVQDCDLNHPPQLNTHGTFTMGSKPGFSASRNQ